jgi:mono/diheme cytochrome c family protein
MRAVVRRPPARALAIAALAAAGITGCSGGGDIKVEESSQDAAGLFLERCSGCHSLDVANSYGSKPKGQLGGGERTNGPNFNVRKVDRDDALFAIRNGGFSGAIMPANIVVGREATALAEFLAKYSGRERTGSDDIANPDSNAP